MTIAGTAEILVRPDTSGFADDMKSKIGDALKNPLVVAGAAVAAAGAAVGAFAATSINKFESVGASVKQLSTLTGLGAEATSKLSFAAEETGVSTDALGVGIKKLSTDMETHNKNLNAAGIAYTDAKGQLLPLDTTLGNVAAKFASMPNGVAKNTLAIQLFGKSGTDLLPILNKGKQGLTDLENEATKYGLVLTQNNLDAIQKNIQAHRDFQAAVSGVQVQLGAALLPVLTSVVTTFNSDVIPAITSVTGFISGSQGLHDALTDVTDGIGKFLTAAGPIAQVIGKDAVNAIQSFVSGFGTGDSSLTDGLTGLSGLFNDLGATVKTVFSDASIAWGSFVDGWNSNSAVGAEVGGLATTFAILGAAARDLSGALKDVIDYLVAHPTVFKDTALAIGAVVTAYEGFKTTKKVIDFGVSGVQDVLGAISNITQGISGVAGKVINFGASQTGDAAAKGAAQGAGTLAGGNLSGTAGSVAQNVVGGAAANAIDAKALSKTIGTALKDAVTIAIPVFLIDVGEALAGAAAAIGAVIFSVPVLIGVAVVAVAALAVAFHSQILGFIEQIPGWIGDGLNALGDFGFFLLQKGVELFQGLVSGLESLALNFPSYLFDLIQAQAFALGFLGGLLLQAGMDLLGGLFNGIQAIWDASIHFFVDLPGNVLTFLGDLGHILYDVGSALLNGLWDGIKFVWNSEVHFWTDIVPNVLSALGDLTQTLYQKGLDLLHGIWQGIQDAWNDPIGFFKGLGSTIWNALGDFGRTLESKGKDLLSGLWNGIQDGWKTVWGWETSLGNTITGGIGDATKWLEQAGKDIIQGLLNGINAIKNKVTDAIGQLGSDVKKGFTSALNIGSPSKDFHQYGVFIGQGLINGINEISPKAVDAMNGMLGKPTLNGPALAGASGGGSTVIHSLVINNNKPLDQQLAELDRLAPVT